MSGDQGGPARGRERGGMRTGAALRRAWVGYQRRVNEALVWAGFDDRRFPDARVLRLCRRSGHMTVAQLGRELGITRQGAGKVIASLGERGYVSLRPSDRDGREKIIELTPRAQEFLAALRQATLRIDDELRAEVGAEAFEGLHRLLHALGNGGERRLDDALRQLAGIDILGSLEDGEGRDP